MKRNNTPVIFLDTNIFIKGNYLQYKDLKTLFDCCAQGFCEVKITDIVHREILNNIEKNTQKAISAIDKWNVAILKNIHEYKIFYDMYIAPNEGNNIEISKTIINSFEKKLKESKIEIVKSDECRCKEVFDDYFNHKGVFKNKSNQFPDAFNLYTIKNWADTHKYKKVYFVTEDKDFDEVDITNINFDFKKLPQLVHWLIECNNPTLMQSVLQATQNYIENENRSFVSFLRSNIEEDKLCESVYDELSEKNGRKIYMDDLYLNLCKEDINIDVDFTQETVSIIYIEENKKPTKDITLSVVANLSCPIQLELLHFVNPYYTELENININFNEYESEVEFYLDCTYSESNSSIQFNRIEEFKIKKCRIY